MSTDDTATENDDTTTENDDETKKVGIRFSSYDCSPGVSASSAMRELGGEEKPDSDTGSLIWVFDAPETVQELLQKCITSYKGEDYALKWFDFLDSRIDDDKGDIDSFHSRYYGEDESMNAYARIEEEWITKNHLEDEFSKFKENGFPRKTEMGDATDDEWRDAFILNRPRLLRKRPKREANGQLAKTHDFIDDLALIYSGLEIYVGVRKYDTIEAHVK